MNTPTPLSWLLQASSQQLSAFCEHNPALVTLLFDSWQKFQQERADLFVQAAFAADLSGNHVGGCAGDEGADIVFHHARHGV